MKALNNVSLDGKRPILPVLKRVFSVLFLAGAVMLLGVTPGKAANYEPGSWQFMAEVYLWYANISGENAAGGDIQIDDNDLIDDLDFGFMTTLGAKKDKLSFLVDVIYLDVSDNTNTVVDDVGVNLNVNGFAAGVRFFF